MEHCNRHFNLNNPFELQNAQETTINNNTVSQKLQTTPNTIRINTNTQCLKACQVGRRKCHKNQYKSHKIGNEQRILCRKSIYCFVFIYFVYSCKCVDVMLAFGHTHIYLLVCWRSYYCRHLA